MFDQLEFADLATPIAIVLAAAVAALFAYFNHRQQLQAEDRRVRRRLRHDRHMRDRGARRTVFDQTLAVINETFESIVEFAADVRDLVKVRQQLQHLVGPGTRITEEVRDRLIEVDRVRSERFETARAGRERAYDDLRRVLVTGSRLQPWYRSRAWRSTASP